MKNNRWWKILGLIVGGVVAFFIIVIGVLTATEYSPKEKETLEISGKSNETLSVDSEISVLSWNIGYGCLGENADFFMDGGKMVKTADKKGTLRNMNGIAKVVQEINPNIALFQEVDEKAMRSNWVNEVTQLTEAMKGKNSSFAYNYRSLFVPYPLPPIGTVNAGILTVSDSTITEATRLSLPNPFHWPYRVGSLKRCLAVNRIPITNTDKELVVVNLHLEAYDSGEGKVAQTKMLKEILQKEVDAGNYVIAAGDFNQIFSNVKNSYPVRKGLWEPGTIDTEDFGEDFQLMMDNRTPSCRSLDQPYKGAKKESFQYYIIDGFIVSSNIKITSFETKELGFQYSDHNPVVMKMKLNKVVK